jgi:hypothetical protein
VLLQEEIKDRFRGILILLGFEKKIESHETETQRLEDKIPM